MKRVAIGTAVLVGLAGVIFFWPSELTVQFDRTIPSDTASFTDSVSE